MNAIDKCVRVPISDAIIPFYGLARIITNSWWIITENDEILFYGVTPKHRTTERGAPQCNSDKRCVEAIRDKLYPGLEVRQIPVVFTRANAEDWR